LQSLPSTQVTHAPALLHTMPVVPAGEQLVPGGRLPVSVHTENPVEQTVAAVLQMLPGWQVTPAAQVTHIAPRQTAFAPHTVAVPSGSDTPVSVQIGTPVSQARVPLWQGFAGGQLPPPAHAAHAPSAHTLPAPQLVPFALFPDGIQLDTPVAQDVVPTLHGSLCVHDLPAAQATHVPALHTLSVPQDVPFPISSPVSMQLIVGEQTVLPE
jgi:hypothetical protein